MCGENDDNGEKGESRNIYKYVGYLENIESFLSSEVQGSLPLSHHATHMRLGICHLDLAELAAARDVPGPAADTGQGCSQLNW